MLGRALHINELTPFTGRILIGASIVVQLVQITIVKFQILEDMLIIEHSKA